ncbi:MAG TPA: hypothetical protein PK156_02305 [Polyangium sp.]|nr:hypothetical protein [Polyangium sp.]
MFNEGFGAKSAAGDSKSQMFNEDKPMADKLTLKKISAESISKALELADHYRLLNEPAQAESICRDILAADPGHVGAKKTLLLALSDQLIGGASPDVVRAALELAKGLPDEYERVYYTGVVHEREGRAHVHGEGTFAYSKLRQAAELFEKAERIRPVGNDAAILRYNACVRAIETHHLKPPVDAHDGFLE